LHCAEELRKASAAEAAAAGAAADPDAEEGWAQSLIMRIAANVSLDLRGLTLKYVEVGTWQSYLN
jgi:hypothetical protein